MATSAAGLRADGQTLMLPVGTVTGAVAAAAVVPTKRPDAYTVDSTVAVGFQSITRPRTVERDHRKAERHIHH